MIDIPNFPHDSNCTGPDIYINRSVEQSQELIFMDNKVVADSYHWMDLEISKMWLECITCDAKSEDLNAVEWV